MDTKLFPLRDLPRYENLQAQAARYPTIDPLSTSVWVLLQRITSDFREAMDSFLSQHHMSRGRWLLLMLLNRDPSKPLNPCDLAERAGVTRATVTGLLDGLEREGLVAREPTAEDRRMLMIRLTSKGREYLDAILPDYFGRVRELLKPLPEREKRQLAVLLSRLGAGLEGVAPPAEMSAKP